jgi:trans-aconitate 2-methyltransferase
LKSLFFFVTLFSLLLSKNIFTVTHWEGDIYSQYSQPQLMWFAQFSNTLPIEGNEDILDIGCGDGKLTHEIANRLRNGTILGIDISKSMIDFAKNTHKQKNLSFTIGDARTFKLNKKFDLIVSFTALHWVKEFEQVIQHAKEHLKPGGKIYFVFSTKWNGLPIEKAMNQLYATKKWVPFFKNYDPGYYVHNVDPWMTALVQNCFTVNEIAIKSKTNIFKTEEELFYWLKAWLPQQYQVPVGQGDQFIREFINEYMNYGTKNTQGIHWDGYLMKVDATLKASMPQNPTQPLAAKSID